MSINSPKILPRLSAGFSLIELTVALLIVVLLAGIALRSTNELSFQVRYEQTQERLNRIKEAIIGNPHRTVNGQPDISGFVADMGRLPDNVRELLQTGSCLPDTTIARPSLCTGGNTWTWSSVQNYSVDAVSHLIHGWRGPYLTVSNSPDSSDAFTDGWGRESQGYCSDPAFTTHATCAFPATWIAPLGDHNYGWWYSNNDTAITAFSYGKDHVSGGNGYDSDYPVLQPLIRVSDWQITIIQGLDITLSKPFGGNNFCGFSAAAGYVAPRDCKNAGGSWTSPNCTVDETSCKSVGGKWRSCFLAPTACTAAGGTPAGQCQFTEKSCNSADGDPDTTATTDTAEWDSINHVCNLNASNCGSAGGNWNATLSQCVYNKSQCAIAGGTWFDDCAFTATSCINVGGTSGTNPTSCSFIQSACQAINGQSSGSDCYMSHAEFIGEKYTTESCQAASGQNSAGARTARICLNVFYRNPNTSLITFATSNPVYIDENGHTETVHFTVLDTNDIDGDTTIAEPMPWIPAGLDALAVYEYDGDCDPVNNPMYPMGHTAPLPIYFNPYSQLPAINW